MDGTTITQLGFVTLDTESSSCPVEEVVVKPEEESTEEDSTTTNGGMEPVCAHIASTRIAIIPAARSNSRTKVRIGFLSPIKEGESSPLLQPLLN